MNIVATNTTVAAYCQEMGRNEIIVNKEYQRSDKVWPPVARSYLIETLLLGYPIPKLSLHQVTDIKSKKTLKEIVDGQQRSMAIFDFFHDRLPLSRTLDSEGIARQNLFRSGGGLSTPLSRLLPERRSFCQYDA